MKHLKVYEAEYKNVKLSDVIDSGNMSAAYHINKDKGLFPYVKENGVYVLIDIDEKRTIARHDKTDYVPIKKSIPKNAVWLKPDYVEKYNELAKKIKELEEDQENLNK